jgi:hypothetical protein
MKETEGSFDFAGVADVVRNIDFVLARLMLALRGNGYGSDLVGRFLRPG